MQPAPEWIRTQLFVTPPMGKEFSELDLFWVGSGPLGATFDPALCAADFASQFGSQVSNLMGTDSSVIGAHVVAANTSWTYGGSSYATLSGAGTGLSMPEELCVVVSLYAHLAGRHGRGRVRIAAIDQDQVDGNYLTTAGQANADSLATAIIAGFTSQSITFTPQLVNKTAGTLAIVHNSSAQGLLGTQRRRKPRF